MVVISVECQGGYNTEIEGTYKGIIRRYDDEVFLPSTYYYLSFAATILTEFSGAVGALRLMDVSYKIRGKNSL